MTPSIKPALILSGTLLIVTAAILDTVFDGSRLIMFILMVWGMGLTFAAFGEGRRRG